MCGIAAIIKHTPLPDSPALIRKMTAALAHRGPDADGHYDDEWVCLGHRRLSIIDLSDAAIQPMWDLTGRYAIVFNGEIYNYREIKSQLPPSTFNTASDTEVILNGFATWGTAIFEKLNGIFAFVLYDRQTCETYIVRDRFGIKPLYYTQTKDYVAVASEQRSILASGLASKRISTTALGDYLIHGAVSGTQRICEDIQELPAGHFIYISREKGVKITYYHRFFENITPVLISKTEAQKQVRHLLCQAVERQLVSDVPLGAFLSGGIDSSAIVALMSEVSTSQPKTFSIGFEESQFDESHHAAMIAQKFNTDHTLLRLKPDDFLHELPNALHAMDTPSLDGINTYVVSKLTRKAGVTVALSGLGGDELFAGYLPFKRFLAMQKQAIWSVPSVLRQPLAACLLLSRSSKWRRMGELLQIPKADIEYIYRLFRSVLDKKSVTQLTRPAHLNLPIDQFLRENSPVLHKLPLLSQYSAAEMSGYTQYMLLKDTDQMSMASALEVRVPFFDNDLVRFVLSLPDDLKYPHTPKELLVQSLGDLLPPEIVHRPKMGFTLPWVQWIKGPLRDFCDTHIQSACDRGLLSPDLLNQKWKAFQKGDPTVLWSQIWMFVIIEFWIKENID